MNKTLLAHARTPLFLFLTASLLFWGIVHPAEAKIVHVSAETSNVLFLPGVEGSRLYTVSDERLWNPSSGADISALSLDTTGKSLNEVYAKEGETINEVGPFKFYDSFAAHMTALKDAGTITDWRPIAYDWRFSPADIVANGAQHGTHIDYSEATDTPYIEQTLRELAATSNTGKVTIVAHSYGGLVAKALMQKLGNAETARLIDDVIFVGVPQSGTPSAIAGALQGYGLALPVDWCAAWEGIGSLCASSASRSQSRTLAENLPGIYSLIPSTSYFRDVQDPNHPVVSFTADHLFAAERSAYGTAIDSEGALISFGTAAEGGRAKPAQADLETPNVLNANLFALAAESHAALDAWTPPFSVNVYQIAGWGDDTLSGIQYYEAHKLSFSGGYLPRYRPQFVEDGDGTVVVPSALQIPAALNVTQFWVNLSHTLLPPLGGANHSTLLELNSVQDFIQDVLTHNTANLSSDLLDAQPQDINPQKKLLFTVHGSARVTLKNATGLQTILNADGSVIPGIEGIQAGEFGDVGYLLAPIGDLYQLILDSDTASSIDVDVQQTGGNTPDTSTTIEDIPVGPDASSTVDVDADGTVTSTSTDSEDPPADTEPPPDTSQDASRSPSASIPSDTQESPPEATTTIPTAVAIPIVTSTPQPVVKKPKVVKVPKPKAVVVPKKAATLAPVTPKPAAPKPLTAKARAAIYALLNQLIAQLQVLLLKLKQQTS